MRKGDDLTDCDLDEFHAVKVLDLAARAWGLPDAVYRDVHVAAK